MRPRVGPGLCVQVLGRYSNNRGDAPDLLDRCLALEDARRPGSTHRPTPRGLKDRLSDADRAVIVASYVTGTATLVTLAGQYGISDYSVRKVLRQAGVAGVGRSVPPDVERQIRDLLAQGRSVPQAAREFGIPETTVRLLLEKPPRSDVQP